MAKGKTTVIFSGGQLDKHCDDNFDTRALSKVIRSPKNILYVLDPKTNNIGIVKSEEFSLPTHWLSFPIENYHKQERASTTEPFHYVFDEKEAMVERCTAFTLKGKRCSREAIEGKAYCNATHEKWANPQLIENPLETEGIIKP